MAGVLTRAGRRFTAEQLTDARASGDVEGRLILFTNAATFGVNPAVGDFVEAEFGGYDPKAFLITDQLAPTLDGDDYVVSINGGPQVWDCTSAPETIRGWALLLPATNGVFAYDVYETPHVLEVGSRHTLYADVKIGQCA